MLIWEYRTDTVRASTVHTRATHTPASFEHKPQRRLPNITHLIHLRPQLAADGFAEMYKRAAPLQGSMALIGGTAALVAAGQGGHCSKVLWGCSGALALAAWPWTLLAMVGGWWGGRARGRGARPPRGSVGGGGGGG